MAISVASALRFAQPGGGSSDPNTLDDYVEGKWTPDLTAATTPPTGVTYSAQMGNYTKIGRLLIIHFRVDVSSLGSSGAGAVRLGGLPYTIPNMPNLTGPFQGQVYWENITMTGFLQLTIQPIANTSQLSFTKSQNLSGGVLLDWANLSATARLRGTVFGQMGSSI